MKTLDEVISILTYCTNGGSCTKCQNDNPDCDIQKDALHWLKTYQDHIELDKAWYERDTKPLTWDELLEMVNKPVWIEEYYPVMEDETGATEDEGQYERHWAIVREANGKKIWIIGPNINYGLGRMSYGVTWQAYREERK